VAKAAVIGDIRAPEVSFPVGRPVIRGHVPVRRPILDDDAIAIDAGCGTIEGGRLTAVMLPERVS